MLQCPLESFVSYVGGNIILHHLPRMKDIIAIANDKNQAQKVRLRQVIEKADPAIRRLAFSIHNEGQLTPIDANGKTIYDGIRRWLAVAVLKLQGHPTNLSVRWHLPDDCLSTGGSQN